MKRKVRLILAACLAAALACLPVSGLADPIVPDTWEGVEEIYGGPDVVPLDFPVYLSQRLSWLSVLDMDELSGYGSLMVVPYAADGNLISEADWADARPATGQHALGINLDQSNYVMVSLIIKGDVLGTGLLNIAQLTRLAQDLNGSKPLAGVYAEAGDLNGNGRIDIGDLPILAQWLTGRIPRTGASLPGLLSALF